MGSASSSPPEPITTEISCPQCETSMPANVAFCPGCGRSMKPLPSRDRIAAAIAYSTLLPAAVVLVLPAFRGSRFVHFHAWQSILLWGAFFVAAVIGISVSNLAAAVALLLIGIISSFGMFFLWIVLSLKAWRGERFELPLFGDLAGRLS